MKNFKYLLVVVVFLVGVVFIINKKPAVAPVVDDTVATKTIELCFAKFGQVMPNPNGFEDKYTLRLSMTGDKATGELKFLPAEKDSKVGKFEGTVSAVDKIMMARTVNAWWKTMQEGISATEELSIIFGEGTASVGFGEMVDRGDGVYVYKDKANIKYNLELSDVACGDLTERDNVESYVRANINTLSPVKPVLGGTWYALSVNIDAAKNSGNVTYEDGHIQQKKNFTYTIDSNLVVTNLTLK
jgi:hypothetical protein